MTEKEFEQLKVGDKVWVGVDWFSDNPKKDEITSFKVEGKEWGEEATGSVVFCGGVSIKRHRCFLTKTEAWEYKVKCYEEFLVNHEKALDRYKAELAKAKEEESGWVIINEKVYKETPYISFPSSGFQRYPTEREAYEALAKFYERKLFKALEKCGYKFVICCDKNIAAVKINEDNGEFCWGYYYPHFSYGSIRKTNIFDTLEEAEAELERRKK